MDEYLSEKEQIEQIKQWWNENGWYLIGGALLAALGWFGYNQYQAWQQRTAEAASSVYESLRLALDDDDREAADNLLRQLSDEYPDSAYTVQARFLVAEDYLVRDPERAIAELEAVVDEAEDPGLVRIARLRLARVLAYDEQYGRALEMLSVPDPGAFSGAFSEVRGDIHLANDDIDAAISAYTDALLGGGNGTVNTELVQLKLNDLLQRDRPDNAGSDVAGSEATTGEATETDATETDATETDAVETDAVETDAAGPAGETE